MSWPKELPKPNLFLIGGAKCGTTTIARYLANQREVCWSEPKEPWYFCQEDLGARGERKKSLSWYARCFRNWKGERYLGDGSVSYMYSQLAVRKIQYFNPKAKFLVILRNPLDTVISLHRQMLYNKQESEPDFKKAWDLEPERRKGQKIPWKCANPKFLFYSAWCDWASQLENIWKIVDRDRTLVLFFEDLLARPTFVESRISEFLEIKLESGLDRIHENAHGDPLRWSVWVDNMLWRFLPAPVRSKLPVDSGKKRDIDMQLRKRLARAFLPSLERLAEMLPSEYVKAWRDEAKQLVGQ